MYLVIFATSLFFTLLIEVPLSMLFGVRQKGILIAVLANMLTNPAAVCLCLLVQVFMPPQCYLSIQIVIEVLVILVEGSIYRSFLDYHCMGNHPWLMALTLNVISYSTGLFIHFLL